MQAEEQRTEGLRTSSQIACRSLGAKTATSN